MEQVPEVLHWSVHWVLPEVESMGHWSAGGGGGVLVGGGEQEPSAAAPYSQATEVVV